MWAYVALALLGISFCLLYNLATLNHDYWKKRGINGPKPIPIIGSFKDYLLRKKTLGQLFLDYYKEFSNEQVVGIYQGSTPILMLKDTELIQQVLVKDFDNFVDRGFKRNSNILADHLISAEGDIWRVLRYKISPIFTAGKLKNMFYLFTDCAKLLNNHTNELLNSEKEFEVSELCTSYTIEVTISCLFGLSLNGFSDKENCFRKTGEKVSKRSTRLVILELIDNLAPGLLKTFGVQIHDPESISFWRNLVSNLIKQRQGESKVRHDFLDLIIKLREEGIVKKSGAKKEWTLEMTDELIAAQAGVFFMSGFETSSSILNFALYELSLNKVIQEKARKEVDGIYEKYGELTFDSLKDLVYLEMVIRESLRKYPSSQYTMRKALNDYTFTDSRIEIKRGTKVIIPIFCIHQDCRFFPDPEKFDPERFSKENMEKLSPCAYIPFGEGPRNCIGVRFANVQIIVGLATILRNYILTPSPKMDGPLKFDPYTNAPAIVGGTWAMFQRRNI